MTKTTGKLRMGAVVLAAALLAACGGGDKEEAETPAEPEVSETVEAPEAEAETVEVSAKAQKLIDMCVAEGESAETCGCQINAVEDALGEEDFAKLITLAEADDEAGAEAMMTEIMTEKPDVAMKMGTSMMACAQ